MQPRAGSPGRRHASTRSWSSPLGAPTVCCPNVRDGTHLLLELPRLEVPQDLQQHAFLLRRADGIDDGLEALGHALLRARARKADHAQSLSVPHGSHRRGLEHKLRSPAIAPSTGWQTVCLHATQRQGKVSKTGEHPVWRRLLLEVMRKPRTPFHADSAMNILPASHAPMDLRPSNSPAASARRLFGRDYPARPRTP
jgi:hypothetical protein